MLKGTKRNHSLFEQNEFMHCVEVFPTQDALDNHFNRTHRITEQDLALCTSRIALITPLQLL